jgi:proline dehydrogenase
MLRNTLLYLSHQPQIFRFVRHNALAKKFASRFVAGETLVTACDAVAELKTKGISASLDLLGESVSNEAEARETAKQYLELIDEMKRRGLEVNVSVKLTALGQDISDALCEENIRAILAKVKGYGGFVRLDMEGSPYTQRTIDFFSTRLYPDYPDNVGIVLQSALRRTLDDVEWSIGKQCRVRICKGAYLEPATVAFPDKKDVDATYVTAMKRLMERGRYAGLATHDEVIIAEAVRFAKERGIAAERFEFQMLYGVRRDLQEKLVKEGWRVRCYVPFGTQWYPYLMRRLAERPANVAFITGNVVKEMVRGR